MELDCRWGQGGLKRAKQTCDIFLGCKERKHIMGRFLCTELEWQLCNECQNTDKSPRQWSGNGRRDYVVADAEPAVEVGNVHQCFLPLLFTKVLIQVSCVRLRLPDASRCNGVSCSICPSLEQQLCPCAGNGAHQPGLLKAHPCSLAPSLCRQVWKWKHCFMLRWVTLS